MTILLKTNLDFNMSNIKSKKDNGIENGFLEEYNYGNFCSQNQLLTLNSYIGQIVYLLGGEGMEGGHRYFSPQQV